MKQVQGLRLIGQNWIFSYRHAGKARRMKLERRRSSSLPTRERLPLFWPVKSLVEPAYRAGRNFQAYFIESCEAREVCIASEV
jgi:hypothetical protein